MRPSPSVRVKPLDCCRVARHDTPMSYRLVIFDFDGTLADSGPWFWSVMNGVARRYRFREVDRDELEVIRDLDTRTMLERLGVARWKVPLIARHLRRLMTRDIDQIALFPGIGGLIEALDEAGVSIAIVSSNAEANVRRVLGPALAARVGHFACGSSLSGKAVKIRRLLKECGVPPAAVLAIGDEIRDIEAARAVGVACGVVGWGYATAPALMKHRPDWVFGEVADIAGIIDNAVSRRGSRRDADGRAANVEAPPLVGTRQC